MNMNDNNYIKKDQKTNSYIFIFKNLNIIYIYKYIFYYNIQNNNKKHNNSQL